MKVTDRNLAEILKTLSPAERAAIEGCTRAAYFASSEAVERLKASVLRKIKARLKATARRRQKRKGG